MVIESYSKHLSQQVCGKMFCVNNMFLVILATLVQLIYSQTTPTIIFAASTPRPTAPRPTRPPTTTPAPTQPGCRCVPQGTCLPPTVPGIDVRIVNMNCGSEQEWCCGNSGEFTNPCGIRKITDAAAQPVGTAQYGAYPWQVALLTLGRQYIGSGVLIAPNFVVTAAHKVAGYKTSLSLILRLGEWNGQGLTEPNIYVEYRPQQITIHPSFNPENLQNDVAVIRLDGMAPIATAPNINTACLPEAPTATGTRCWVAGWGENAFRNGQYQAILKEVDVPIVDQNTCEARLRKTRLGNFFNLDRTSFICAGGEVGKDACTGDGGAPLVCKNTAGRFYVAGLVAWGIGCASSGVPGVYVNFINYVPWINQQMSAMG